MGSFASDRPFLRCLIGYGLCVWRLGRFDQAAEVLERMLWLNPADNQGGLLPAIRAGEAWEADMETAGLLPAAVNRGSLRGW